MQGNGFDIPAIQTSSVGEVRYPPVVASEQRKKGIFPSVVTLPGDLMQLTGDFNQMPLDSDTTRISARYFVENTVLSQLSPQEREQIEPYMEGIIKLSGDGKVFNDCSIVYLGKNADERHTSAEMFQKELQVVQEIMSTPASPSEHNYAGYSFREITDEDRINEQIIDQYAQLYKAFGWSRNEVIKILQNPTNILLGTFVGDQLISAGMAERAQFFIERGGTPQPFVMYEITEAATREEYRGKGLYTQIASELMKVLAQTDIDLLYGESNAQAPGVLRAAHTLGRTTSIETLAEFGFPPRFLEQHVRISGGVSDNRPPHEKNDLLPTYMTRDTLLKYAYAH